MENPGGAGGSDPEQRLEEMRTVIESLFDTLVKYLRPEAVIDNCSLIDDHQKKDLIHQSSRETTVQNLLDWVLDDERTVSQFTETLRGLTHKADGAVSAHPAISGGTDDDKSQMSQYMKHIVQTIDGSLTKKLSQADVHDILDAMLHKNLISDTAHKQAKALENPHECCLKMFTSVKRGKAEWPFVFLDALKKRRPDLIQLQSSEAVNSGKSPLLALPGTSGGSNRQDQTAEDDASALGELQDWEILSPDISSIPEFSDRQPTSRPMFHVSKEERQELTWTLLIESGTVDENRITADPLEQNKRNRLWNDTCFSDEEEEDLSDEQNAEPKDSKEPPSLPLREYQKELAENALKGRNTIICAPTGSGKTRVAIHIILNHLRQLEGEEPKGKVAFLARTVPLVMQQCKSLKMYLPKTFEVTHLTGDSEDSMHLHMLLHDNDVIVMTPRILENHLKRKCLPHLGVFSMLVFDECHHTRKGEPYNTLMYSYLKTKNNDKDVKLPQIVGLTASISVEKAVQDEEAVKCILQVCGNLDAESISTVEKHEEELKAKVPVPEERMFKLRERENDDTVNKIINIMIKLEKSANYHATEVKHEELSSFLKKIPSDKKSQQYGQWTVKIKNLAKSLPRQEHRETNNSVRSLIIITDYLAAYNVALELYDLVLMRDVMAYLERCFVKFSDNKKRTTGEDTFYEFFAELQKAVKGRLDEENPNLMILKEKLLEYLVKKGEKSCGIIFVRTRALTDALTSWLNRCGDDKLKALKATVFTGTAATVEQGGMTTAEQDEVIGRFKSGEVRLLVATSVGEEGLDIPECNLVIKYNHVGNEVTTVQTRGRSRKEGGMSVLLAMDKILRKERINQEKAKMMARAIKQIRQMKRSKIRKMNLEHQNQIMKDEEILEIVRMQEESRLLKKPFKMVCHLCRKLVIDSQDIKTIFKTHRVVVDSNILKQTKTFPYKDAKYLDEIRMIGSVRCMGEPEEGKHCYNKLGSMLIYSKVPFVVLGIKNFGFDTGGPLGLEFYNQWKKVPYVIDEITPQDFEKYLPQKKEPVMDDDDDGDDSDAESDGSGGGGGGDDDNKGDKPPGEDSSKDESSETSSSTKDIAQAKSDVQDSITELKRMMPGQDTHDEAKGGGKSMTEAKELLHGPDSGVYSDPSLSSGSSVSSQVHSTEVKGLAQVKISAQQMHEVDADPQSVSTYRSGESFHNTPVTPENRVMQSNRLIQEHVFLQKTTQVLKSPPPLSSRFSDISASAFDDKSVTAENLACSVESSIAQSNVQSSHRESHQEPASVHEHSEDKDSHIPVEAPAEVNETGRGPEETPRPAQSNGNSPAAPGNCDEGGDNTTPKSASADTANDTTPKELFGQPGPDDHDNGGSHSPSSQRPSGLDLL